MDRAEKCILVRVDRRKAGTFTDGGVFAVYRIVRAANLNALRHRGTGFFKLEGIEVEEEREVQIEPAVADLLEEAIKVAKAAK